MSETDKIIELRKRLLDVEEIASNIGNINKLLASFAAENSPEGTVVAKLIAKQLNKLQDIIKL